MNRREFLKKLALSPVALAIGLEIAADIIREEGLPPGPELKEAIESYLYNPLGINKDGRVVFEGNPDYIKGHVIQYNYVYPSFDLEEYEYMVMRALSATT